MSRATADRTTCPRCKWNLLKGATYKNALSRRDNKTMVCADCGTQEALEDSRLVPQWLDNPTHNPYWDVKSPVWLVQSERYHDEEQGLAALKEAANELSQS